MSGILSLAEASDAIKARRIAPTAVLEECITRADRLDSRLTAYITRLDDCARADAAIADREIAAGLYRGPLHGIPIGLKDIFDTAGVRTTAGSRVYEQRIPATDAVLVQRLRQAGAIITGKLATYEFAFGGPSNDILSPLPRNPWNDTRVTGGSSSGSAVAVAAGMCLGAMGSDTGGSIRGPSGHCGLAGLKPTYGRLPVAGVLPLAYSLDTAGPMAWTAEDCALMFWVLARSPVEEVTRWQEARKRGAQGARIGVVRNLFEGDMKCAEESHEAVRNACEALKVAGGVITDVAVSSLNDYHACCLVIMLAEAFEIHREQLARVPELYGESARERLVAGAFIQASEYVRANRMRSRLRDEMACALEHCDALLIPTNFSAAGPLANARKLAILEGPYLTTPFNVAGLPTISVNAAFTDDGMPVGVSLAGRPNAEAEILALGEIVEAGAGSRSRRPPLLVDTRL